MIYQMHQNTCIYSNIYVNFPLINILHFLTFRQSPRCCLFLCLSSPLTLVCGGSPFIPLLVHQPASLSITPTGSVHKSRGDRVVRMWVQLKRWDVWYMCFIGGIVVMDVIWRRLCIYCKYDLMKGDMFVLSWAKVRRVRRGSLSS